MTIADGGECLADLSALREQPDLVRRAGLVAACTARDVDAIELMCPTRASSRCSTPPSRNWRASARTPGASSTGLRNCRKSCANSWSSRSGYLHLRDPLVALGLGLLGCLLVLVYAAWLGRLSWVAVAGAGLQAGGALSNVLDRLLVGGANDYLNVSPTFTFNLADILLLVGMALAVASIARRLRSPP